jgi:predicted amino acid dehydrogenase
MFAQNVVQPKLIGLTAYASFSGNKGEDLTKILNTPLTTGASYTMAMIPETILRAVDLMETDLSNSSVLILGATSSIGKYCIEILHHFVKEVFITAHNQDKLNLLLSELPKEKKEKLKYCREVGSILDKTNIIIIATNRLPIGLDFSKVVSGAIIFDASYPRKIPNDARDDVLVIDGVAIRPPGKVNFNFDFGLPPGLCYPCIAEAMILALERKYVNYSVGRDANAIRIREILRWGARHGFEIASLTSREKVITNEDIIKIKHNSLKNRKKKFLLWG